MQETSFQGGEKDDKKKNPLLVDTLKWNFCCFLTSGEEDKGERRESERTKEARDEDVANVFCIRQERGGSSIPVPTSCSLPCLQVTVTQRKKGFPSSRKMGTPRSHPASVLKSKAEVSAYMALHSVGTAPCCIMGPSSPSFHFVFLRKSCRRCSWQLLIFQ